jgi:2,3-bisphosphoglycerate-independent phosphoglycerate mutase
MRTLPSHAVVGRPVVSAMPAGPGAERLHDLMRRGRDVLATHPVCEARRARGEGAPNAIWPWGQGTPARLPALRERLAARVAVVPGHDLERGLARLAGVDVIDAAPAAEGNGHLARAVDATLGALDDHDCVLLQLADIDQAGHDGDAAGKVAAIERLDAEVVGRLLDGLRQRGGEWRLGVLADHPTPCALRTHTAEPVPFVVYVAKDEAKAKGQKRAYHERDARELGIFVAEGHTLIERLLRE